MCRQGGDWGSDREGEGIGYQREGYSSMNNGRGKTETTMRNILWAILIIALVVELVVRPFFPELVRGESYFSDIARLLLGLIGGEMGGGL